MTPKRYYYYQFWIQSSRGTDEVCMRRYDEKPTIGRLKHDVENWCENFGAWHVSENVCSYGWRPVKPPVGRRVARARYESACKMQKYWNNQRRLYADLLQYL